MSDGEHRIEAVPMFVCEECLSLIAVTDGTHDMREDPTEPGTSLCEDCYERIFGGDDIGT